MSMGWQDKPSPELSILSLYSLSLGTPKSQGNVFESCLEMLPQMCASQGVRGYSSWPESMGEFPPRVYSENPGKG